MIQDGREHNKKAAIITETSTAALHSFVRITLRISVLLVDLSNHPRVQFEPVNYIGIGFNGAETNCRIAHILGILLMNSCNTDNFLATTIICSLSALNSSAF